MPGSEYANVTGSALKLKSKTGAGVTKPKKKKKKPTPNPTDEATAEDAQNRSSTPERQAGRDRAEAETVQSKSPDLKARRDGERGLSPSLEKEVADTRKEAGKTEAERRYEERRRKRLDERLRREGVKTHKERVEELNRYLSKLSEHHDMPRIGPG